MYLLVVLLYYPSIKTFNEGCVFFVKAEEHSWFLLPCFTLHWYSVDYMMPCCQVNFLQSLSKFEPQKTTVKRMLKESAVSVIADKHVGRSREAFHSQTASFVIDPQKINENHASSLSQSSSLKWHSPAYPTGKGNYLTPDIILWRCWWLIISAHLLCRYPRKASQSSIWTSISVPI